MTDDPAARFLALHHASEPLVLPNAWDVASARVLESAGFPAIATTSSGVAESLGFEDGEHAPLDEMTAAAARIVRAVSVPVTVDFESGYGLQPEAVVARLSEIGAVGCNIEDTDHRDGGFAPLDEHAAFIRDMRSAVAASGRALVINARVDAFLRSSDVSDAVFEEAVRRANAYLAAGADCVYPIMLADEQRIAEFVRQVPGPVNAFARPGAPSIQRLAQLGVRRITFGGRLFRFAMQELASVAERIRAGEDVFAPRQPV